MNAGRKPHPNPASWAASLVAMSGTVSVSCPVKRPTVRGARRREVSAATTARNPEICASVRGSVAEASGCEGATAKIIVVSAMTRER